MKLTERIQIGYLMARRDIKMGRSSAAYKDERYGDAYKHVNEAIDYELRAVVLSRRVGIETMDLREELRSLKRIRNACLELMSYTALEDAVRNHAEMREIRKIFGKS